MKLLDTFFMEEELENNRFQARFNLGESGHRPRTVEEILCKSGLTREHACSSILNMSLQDSPNWGRTDLRQTVAALHCNTCFENVLITTGTSEALLLLFRALAPKKVAVVLPAFQLLTEIPKSLGAQIVGLPIEFNSEGIPSANVTHWKKILHSDCPDLVVLNTPHNPTGIVFSQEIEEMFVNYCEQHHATLVADEHYRFLASETQTAAPTLFRYAESCKNANIFVTGSFIKCIGAPGLRIGWCVGNRKILQRMQNEKNYTTHTVNPLSEWIALMVLRDLNSEFFQEIRSEWLLNKAELAKFLKNNCVWKGSPPQGGLVSVLAFSRSEQILASVLSKQLSNSSIFILPLSVMGAKELSDTKMIPFRIGLGCKTEQFMLALQELLRLK